MLSITTENNMFVKTNKNDVYSTLMHLKRKCLEKGILKLASLDLVSSHSHVICAPFMSTLITTDINRQEIKLHIIIRDTFDIFILKYWEI